MDRRNFLRSAVAAALATLVPPKPSSLDLVRLMPGEWGTLYGVTFISNTFQYPGKMYCEMNFGEKPFAFDPPVGYTGWTEYDRLSIEYDPTTGPLTFIKG